MSAENNGHRYGPDAIATPANAITLVHLAGSLALVVALSRNADPSLTYLAAHAGLTALDKADGVKARREGPTKLGAELDPVTDAVHMLGLMTVLAATGNIEPYIPLAVGVREVGVKAYRRRAQRNGESMPAAMSGKIKTLAQSIYVGLPLAPYVADHKEAIAAAGAGVTALTLYSGVDAVRQHRKKRK